jgi:hypothetical protein
MFSAPLAFVFWFGLWPILNIAKNIVFIRWAAQRLRAELRATASLGAAEWTTETRALETHVQEALPSPLSN